MNITLTKEQRSDLEKQIDSRWDEVLRMKPIKPSVFVPDDLKIELKNEYIRVIKEIVFIKKAKIIHGDKYDYRLVNYINCGDKVIIICPEHGEFEQTPDKHLIGRGCSKCGRENTIKKQTKPKEQFEKQANEIHGYKYIYFGDYVNNHTEMKMYCKKHKEYFYQTPSNHLIGKKCPKCGLENQVIKRTKTQEQFYIDAVKIHRHKFIYQEDYVNNHTKIKIWCKKCKCFFWQKPNNHLQGKQTCPKCKQSKGETQIENYLKENNIKYETQKKFDGCKHKRSLPFDFYLPDYNILIEFQGIQHYQVKDHFGGEEGYKQRQKRDQIKRDFCSKEENPNLLEIKYTEINNINEILEENINT